MSCVVCGCISQWREAGARARAGGGEHASALGGGGLIFNRALGGGGGLVCNKANRAPALRLLRRPGPATYATEAR
jgi:hypothetical protein